MCVSRWRSVGHGGRFRAALPRCASQLELDKNPLQDMTVSDKAHAGPGKVGLRHNIVISVV